MRDISFGQYYPAQSVVHRLDAKIKILIVIAFIVMVFMVPNFFGYGVVAVFVVLCTLIAKVPIMSMLRSIRPLLYIMLFTVIMTILFYNSTDGTLPLWTWWKISIYKQALIGAGTMICRLVLLVIGPTLLTLTTTPMELTDGIEGLLTPLKWIKIPVQTLAIIMSIALRFIPILIDETTKIINAQKARLANFDSRNPFKKAKAMLPVLIPLFVSSFRRADELADAIDSRCFGYAKHRTRLNHARLKWADLGAVVFVGLFLSYIVCAKYGYLPHFLVI